MIYDSLFADPSYSLSYPEKIEDVRKWLNKGKILDVGCGRGYYIRALKEFDITGLEPSEYLINNDLKDLKVIHGDSFSVKKKYDSLYCMDVLEHIEPEEIEKVLEKLSTVAPRALYGIANHPDRWENVELHLIQESHLWWKDLLSKYYTTVDVLEADERYFLMSCSV